MFLKKEENSGRNIFLVMANKIKKKTLGMLTVLFEIFLPFLKKNVKKIEQYLDKNIEFKTRALYGIIFSLTILLMLIFGGIAYMGLVFLMLCVMIYELLKIVANIEQSNNQMFILLRRYGIIYIATSCISLILIRESVQGLKVSIWMFLVVWTTDSFAYILGKKFGKLKLAPEISPNKTYEGAIFGAICGLFVSIFIYKIFLTKTEHSFSFISFVIFSIITIILAQLGDLSESYIKRQCNVKDSGDIMPGHGGLLDRFDSLLIVAPFIFISIWLNGWRLF